jgi:hypothetical protein
MRRLAVVAVCLAAGLVGCAADSTSAGDRAHEAPRLFLAGDGELWVVESGSERVRRVRMPQLAAGDPPTRILRRGEGLAMWGYDVWRLEPGRPESPPRRIVRRGWFFIASAHPERIWVGLLDPRSPATVNALRAVREVTVDGRVTVRDRRPPRGSWPLLAVRDGLLFSTRRGGWYVWDPVSRRVERRWGPGVLGFPGPAHANVIASCVQPCTSVRLTDAGTGVQRRVPVPTGWVARVDQGAFSPSGRKLAFPVQRRGSSRRQVRLAIVDVVHRRTTVVRGSAVAPGYTFARWSRSGSAAFLTGGERGADRSIVAYRVGEPRARALRVSVGDFFDAAAY